MKAGGVGYAQGVVRRAVAVIYGDRGSKFVLNEISSFAQTNSSFIRRLEVTSGNTLVASGYVSPASVSVQLSEKNSPKVRKVTQSGLSSAIGEIYANQGFISRKVLPGINNAISALA